MRSLRARRQQVQNFLAFVLAFGLDAMSENELRTGLVHAWLIAESEAFERLLDRPSGKYFGDLGDIALRVSAIHADCMQFQQLAAVIFIEAGVLLAPLIRVRRKTAWASIRAISHGPCGDALRLHRVRSHAHPVVEIKEHRWTFRGRHQQIFELSQSMRADRLLLVVCKQEALGTFADENIEVIEPEVGHHFLELALAVK